MRNQVIICHRDIKLYLYKVQLITYRFYRYRDQKTSRLYSARLALQTCVKPGSYNAGPATVSGDSPLETKLDRGEIEWATKERGSVEIFALLVKLDIR